MAGREILELKGGVSSKPCLMTPETKSFLMSEGLHFNALYIYILLYIIFYNQTWQWKIHYDYTRIIILISIDDCPIKTSICGEFSIAIFDYQRIHILLSSWAYQNQSPCFRLRFVGRTCGLSHRRWCLKYVQIISICTLFLHHKNLCANFHHHFLAVGPIWPRHPAHSMQIANAIARKPAVLGGDH